MEIISHVPQVVAQETLVVLQCQVAMYLKLWPRRGLGTSSIRLQTYSKEPIASLSVYD